MGEFFDAAYGFIICAFDFLAIGIAAYNWSDALFGEKAVINIIIGALACSFNILPRLVYQKYTVMTMALSENGQVEIENDSFYDPPIFDGLCAFHLLGYTRSLSNASALHIPGGAIHLRAATHNPSP